jgi:hypothetical protein
MSGSFPAGNIATQAALETMKIKSIINTSVGFVAVGRKQSRVSLAGNARLVLEKRFDHRQTDRHFARRSGSRRRWVCRKRFVGSSSAPSSAAAWNTSRPKPTPTACNDAWSYTKQYSGEEDIQAYINVGGVTASSARAWAGQLFHAGLNKSAPWGGRPQFGDGALQRRRQTGHPPDAYGQVGATLRLPIQTADHAPRRRGIKSSSKRNLTPHAGRQHLLSIVISVVGVRPPGLGLSHHDHRAAANRPYPSGKNGLTEKHMRDLAIPSGIHAEGNVHNRAL